METTKLEIGTLKNQIKQTPDSMEARKLTIKLRELQYLQLWHIDQLQHLGSSWNLRRNDATADQRGKEEGTLEKQLQYNT